MVGKTEGNGGVTYFTRIADQAFRRVLDGRRSAEAVARVPMVWSAGATVSSPWNATVFARNQRTGAV